ncbi:MAG: hypothetical protein JW893_08550 [Candidatus Omnitrophica bacterium]|nr:hypothetical protein [Candidatus Omnitrophota bacterium]
MVDKKLFDKLPFKAPSRVIRYFVLAGVIFFVAFVMRWFGKANLALMGPPIFLAYGIEKLFGPYVSVMTSRENLREYFYLLPLTITYYGLVGFFLKQLLQESGKVGLLSLLAFIGFVIYIHYQSWLNLTGYFEVFPYP